MGTWRESTRQEQIFKSLFIAVQRLDKSLWYSHDKLASWQRDLIEEIQIIRSRCTDLENYINEQCSIKEKP